MDTQTKIHWNGSKFAGEEPDTVEMLLQVLAKEPLSPSFEHPGRFQFSDRTQPGTETIRDSVTFYGNFANVSHAFCVETNDPEMIGTMADAIRANLETVAYKECRDAWEDERRRFEKRGKACL